MDVPEMNNNVRSRIPPEMNNNFRSRNPPEMNNIISSRNPPEMNNNIRSRNPLRNPCFIGQQDKGRESFSRWHQLFVT